MRTKIHSDIRDSFSKKLKLIRKERKMNQSEFAEHIGVSEQSIKDWEQASSSPTLDTISMIASKLDMSIEYLLGYGEAKNMSIQQMHKLTGLSFKALEVLTANNKNRHNPTKESLHEMIRLKYPTIDAGLLSMMITDEELMASLHDYLNFKKDKSETMMIFSKDKSCDRLEAIYRLNEQEIMIGANPFKSYMVEEGIFHRLRSALDNLKKLYHL